MKAFFQTIVNRVLAHRACVVNQNPLRIGQKTPPYPLRTILVPVKYVANRASCIVNRASLLLLLAMVSSVNVWGADVTYTFTSKSWGDVNSAWTSGKDGNGYTSGQGVQITAGVTGANATTKSSFTNVSKIVVNYCTNAKAGKGTIKVQVGSGTEKSYSVSAPSSGGTTLRNTDEFTFSPVETGKIKITVECGTNSIYINSITITTAASYTVNWTINPAAGGTLSATSGTSTTVTPNSAYTYGSPAYTVTSGTAAVSQSTNTFTATPSANCTIRINMVEKPKYTVTLKDDNSTLTQVSVGASVTLPSRTGCTGYAFAGWTKSWTSEQSSWTTTAPTIIPAGSYTPAGNENLYPVYTKTEGGGGTTTKTLYFEPFTGSANSSAVQSTNVAATTDMFTDASATVWSHYSFNAGTTTSYATNLDGDAMSNETKITKQINNSTVTMMEVTGINISNASNLSLSLYNRRSYTSATLSISYKIDNGDYTAVGGTMSYNSTNDRWKLCDGLTINGTGHSLSLKIQLVVSGSTNRTMTLDDIKITGTVSNSTTSYISVPSCGPATYTLNLSTSPTDIATVIAKVNGESVTEAEENATVTLSYSNVTSGYVFDHWYVLNESTLEDETLPDNTFTMPASEVSVKGYFKAIPSISVNVTDVSMTVGETDKTLSITASASDGGTLTYTWYQVDSKTTSGGTQVGTGSSYSIPSNLAAGTYYYYCKVSNGAASITSNCATVTVNSASGYSMHLQNTQDGDKQYFTYGGVGSYSYIDNFVIPEESYCTQFFVGNNGYWYSSNLGNANAKSANWYYGWLPFTTLQDASCGTITLGNATGVIGRLRIDDNSSEDNLHISFDPNGYGFVYGIENNEGWQNIAFVRNGMTNVWKTAALTLTSEMVKKSYYVGLLKENGGYAHSYRSEGNSKGASLTTTILGIGVKSGAGNNFDGTIGSNTTGVGANTQGCFEIWTDNCNQNFYCHFVPDYNYILKDEDDNVLYASAFVSCEATDKSTTIDNSHNPTKTGYQLMGWSRTKGASNVDVALGSAYDYWKSNDVLYPVWREIVYTLDNIAIKNNPTKTTYNQGEELETTGLTLTAHYTDDISGPGKDEVVISGFTCSPTTLSTPGASIPITVTYQGKQTTFNVKVKAVYNVTFNNNGSTTGAPAAIQVEEGSTLGSNLPGVGTMTAPIAGYTFVGWVNHTDAWTGFESTLTQTLITGNETINADVTYDAVWAKGSNDYKLIDNPADFTSGNYIIDGYDDSEDTEEAMNNTLNSSNKIDGAAFPAEDHGVITTSDNSIIWKITVNNNTCALYSVTQSKYLSFTSGEATFSFSTDPVWITASSAVVDDFLEWYLTYNGRYLEYDIGVFDTWSNSNYSTIYLYKQQISNFFVTTPNEYTVTWHKGNAGTATSSAFEGQTFADIVADAPSVDDDAAGDCANKFMGWATESIASNEGVEENAVAWAKDNTTPISGNVDYYAVFATQEGSGSQTEELTNSNVQTITSQKLAYETEKTFSGSALSYSIYGYVDANSRPWIQLKKDLNVYIKITAPEDIKEVVVTITSGQNSSGGILDITKHTAYSGRLALLESDAAGSAEMTGVAFTDAVSNNKMTLTPSGTNKELYLKVSTGARIWGIKTTYGSATYSNYITSCATSGKVTYDANDATSGSVPVDDTEYDFGTDVTVLDNTGELTKEHYHFAGWNTSADGSGTTYQAGATFTISSATTLYAKWEINTHSLTWITDGDELTGDYTHGTVAYGTTIVQPDIPTKTGYTFNGWYDGSAVVVPGGSLMPDNDLTFTATWTINSYTLSWNFAGGATSSENYTNGTVEYNAVITYPADNTMSREGYEFTGWSPANLINMPAEATTITALWAPVIVITSQPTDKICYQDDEDVSLAIVATIGEGTLTYQWQSSANGTDGWADIANATEATYHPSTNTIGTTYYRCVVTSNLGLTATSSVAAVTVNQKLSNKYTITYAFDAWSTDPGTQVLEVDGGSTVTLPAGMTKEGYNFVKWEMSDGTFKQPGETFTMPTENIVILAVLEEIQQTISYTVNGSAAAQLTAWTAQPATVNYWDNDLTAEYTITPGYYVSAAAVTVNDVALTDGEIAVDNEMIYIIPDAGKFAGAVSITLTVEPMQYTVTLSALGATNTYTSQVEATFGQEMPAIAVLPVRPGYTFQGYFDAETDGTQYYLSTGASAHAWDKPAGATLYAQWSTDSYGITYSTVENLAWGEKPATINIETDMLTANYTVTNGYEVTGMTVTVGGATIDESAIAYDNETVIIETTFSGAVVITPTVTPIHYTITYLKNDGSASSSIQEAVYMQDVTLKDGTAFKRKGYTIDHWATEDETVTYAKGYTFEPYNLTSDLTLKAIWAVKESDWYTITFVDQMQDTEVEPIRGISTIDGFTFPTLEDKETPPDDTGQCNVQHYHFMGWIAESDKDNEITESNIIKGGTEVPAASVTANAMYYAIWATATIQ